eukprot:UN10970
MLQDPGCFKLSGSLYFVFKTFAFRGSSRCLLLVPDRVIL